MRIKIGTKILIVLCVLFVEIVMLMAAFSITNRYHEDIMRKQHTDIKRLDSVKSFQILINRANITVSNFIHYEAVINNEGEFNLINKRAEGILDEMERLGFKKARDVELLKDVNDRYLKLKAAAVRIFSLPTPFSVPDVRELRKEMSGAFEALMADSESIHQSVHHEIDMTETQMIRIKSIFDLSVVVGIMLNIILIFAAFIFFKRTISAPIISMRNTAVKVSKGSLEEKVSVESNDEIGDLALSFNKMIENIKDIMQEEKECAATAAKAASAEKKKALELEEAYEKLKMTQDQLIQAEKMEVIGRLASGVAHEVKNPLAIIVQWVEYLMGKIKSNDENVPLALDYILSSAQEADRFVKGLLDLSRLHKINVKKESLNPVLEKSLFLLKYQIAKNHIQVIEDLANDIPDISIDGNRCEQVFVNLFLNSIQAMPKGGELRITTFSKKAVECDEETVPAKSKFYHSEERIVVTTIEDTGPGISEEILDKIFDHFFTTKHEEKGTGLGLPIVRNIIELHGGDIEIMNKNDDCGTKVTVMFKA